MTTNVFDGHAGMLATDSRWSAVHGNFFVYLDDTGFEKIELYEDYAFSFAGLGIRVQEWKSWIRSNPQGPNGMPGHDGMAVCMVNIPVKEVIFARGQGIVHEKSHFAGTGSTFAFQCWSTNKDAKRSIETAKSFDICTGGEVKHFDCKDRSHNLIYGADVSYSQMMSALSQRGVIMTMNTEPKIRAPFTLREAAASNDPEMQELAKKAANGELEARAPCDGMYTPWSNEEKQGFGNALAKAFGWKK